VEALAPTTETDRVRAYAEPAQGRVASAGNAEGGLERLERAISMFAQLGMDLEVGRTRLGLARALREIDRQAPIAEGRSALSALHSARASYERDIAAALLRELCDESSLLRIMSTSSPAARQRSCGCSVRVLPMPRSLGGCTSRPRPPATMSPAS
jgi:hypothetical protein